MNEQWTRNYRQDDWTEALHEFRELLVGVAMSAEGPAFVTPVEVMNAVHAIQFDRPRPGRLGPVLASLLRQVDAAEIAAARPMLSALVRVERSEHHAAFSIRARRLGRRGSDDEELWLAEAIAVRRFWSQHRDPT